MDHVYQASVSTVSPPAPAPGSSGHVQSEPPLPTYTPTTPGPFWYWHKTESIRNVILAAGLTPDPQNLHQLADAIELLANPPPPPTDPYWADVILLLSGEGTTGSTSITDSSAYANVLTNAGGIAIVNDGANKFTGGAIAFPGGDAVLEQIGAPFNFNSTSYTAEAWVYAPEVVSNMSLFSSKTSSFFDGWTSFFIESDGGFQWYAANAEGEEPLSVYAPEGSFTAGAWHFASVTQIYTGSLTNLDNQILIHMDGALLASYTGPVRGQFGAQITIGDFDGSQSFAGRLQEYRVTVAARYTAAPYDVPTSRFPTA